MGEMSIFLRFLLLLLPTYYLRPSFLSPPPSRNSDPGSHCRLPSPLPTRVRALRFYRQKTSFGPLFPRRILAPTVRKELHCENHVGPLSLR